MDRQIWITGMGIASSIGMNVEESLGALVAGRRGIGPIRILDTIHKDDFRVGEIPFTDQQIMEMLEIPAARYRYYTRTSMIGMIAAREALEHSGIDLADGVATALVSATTVGGMDKTEREFAGGRITTGFVATHPCGDSTDKIAEFLGIEGYRTTLSTACSSGANAILHAARLIKHGFVERALVGGVDALSKFTLNGFNSLMILDREDCRPFDHSRKGLNLGEGAGFLVLESDRVAEDHRKICRLSGYANANDAHHQTASSPDGQGAYDAMNAALSMSRLPPGGISTERIDYINAHGTGTENNDASEGAALVRIFGDQLPPFSSTKAFTGHTLGAAAGIEAVFSVLAIREGIIFPSLGFSEPMETPAISPVSRVQKEVALRHVLSNSFGFGGNNSTLIFSKS
ncbi:MAG: beta-ketoacyl-[acyl-carrier-protein] synthase family protein [Bacteroidetes bacterium]|nr:beta-ketoacyl-[acyl-carrier-protein] synthase family protein [Bacteroidota bacterium]